MARRARRNVRGGWVALLVLVAVALALWWFSARRAEAPSPPPSAPGARVIGQPPGSEEITPPEKEELKRILRERGAASPVAP